MILSKNAVQNEGSLSGGKEGSVCSENPNNTLNNGVYFYGVVVNNKTIAKNKLIIIK